MIEKRIYLIRGHRVMLSPQLAMLYGVKAKALIQAVKRNKERFPSDFMFFLSPDEERSLRSQSVTLDESTRNDSSKGRGRYSKYPSYAFTEQGVAMLSSVLRSKRAVRMNITIMRTFVKIREVINTNKDLAQKFQELERKLDKHDGDIRSILEVIQHLITAPQKPKRQIGFHVTA